MSLHHVTRVRVSGKTNKLWLTSVIIFNDRGILRKFHDIGLKFLPTPQSVLPRKPSTRLSHYRFDLPLPEAKQFPKISPSTRQVFPYWRDGESPLTSQIFPNLPHQEKFPTVDSLSPHPNHLNPPTHPIPPTHPPHPPPRPTKF